MDEIPTLHKLREDAELTQVELATKAQVRQQYVSDLETGRRRSPNAWSVARLAKALGVSQEQFLASLEATQSQLTTSAA